MIDMDEFINFELCPTFRKYFTKFSHILPICI